jgi:hypothetical protein
MNAATHRDPIAVTPRPSYDYRGLPSDSEFVVAFYTEDTRKGVGRRLRDEIRVWAKWFRSCGAADIRFVTKRAQYHQAGALILGTCWSIKVTI